MVRLGLFGAASTLYSINPELATQFLDVDFRHANFDDRFLLSAWGTLSARMRLLLTENTLRCFSGSDFTASQIMKSDKPIPIYLSWPERDLLALAPLVRLLWGSLIDELITTYDSCNGLNCKPVLLLVDEAGRTAIPSLADHATTVAGRSISLWVAIQSLSQLDMVYGRTRSVILRDNMDTQIFYRPSNQDTADYLQRCLGYKSGFASSQSTYKGNQINKGLSEREVPLMTAQAIKQVNDEDIIGFHRGLPPFRARRMDWRRLALFRGLQNNLTPSRASSLRYPQEFQPPL